MLSKYWKNAVITGATESFCLACETRLRTVDDVESHIEQSGHTEKLDSTPYYDKYKHDLIREISSGYFCEACNLLYDTDLEVDLHVVEARHAANLSKQVIKRSGDTVLAYNEILITERAWSGFIGSTCVICKAKVDDENVHKNNNKHILNLIQSKFEFLQGKAIYRHVQVINNLQCLTCNELVEMSAKSTHCNSTEHKNKYENHRVSNIINNDVEKYTQSDVQVQEKKKPKKNKNKKLNVNILPKKAKNNPNKGLNKTDIDEIEDYVINVLGAKNYITNKDNKKWCLLCDWAIDDLNENQHVQSRHHLTLLKLHKERIAKINAGGSDFNEPDSKNDDSDTDGDDGDDRILDSIDDFGKHGIKVNFETCSVSCRKCSGNVDFNYDSIKNHIQEHNKKDTTKDTHVSNLDLNEKNNVTSNTLHTKQMTKKDKHANTIAQNEELISFAKKHELILKNDIYYCSTCNVSLEPNVNKLEEHIRSTGHKDRISRMSKTPKQVTRSYAARLPLKEFLKTGHVLENLPFLDIVINGKYCISLMSFHLLAKYNNTCICHLCDVTIPIPELNTHTNQHAEKLQDILVIASVPYEFLRQIRIGVYHCGFCNMTLESEELDDHLDSTSHNENRKASQFRLEQYLPSLKNQEEMDKFMFLQMLGAINVF